jgi:periplasmic divalent cation tolerance protein
MSAFLIYVTTGDAAAAKRIGREVVTARLAACANVHEGITSFYWWDGCIQEDSEAVLMLKTRADLVEALTAKIVALHADDCPCVVALPIEGGNPAFLDWIAAQTRGA